MGQALLLIGGTIVASSDKTDAIFGENITINGGNIDAKGGEYGGAICAAVIWDIMQVRWKYKYFRW